MMLHSSTQFVALVLGLLCFFTCTHTTVAMKDTVKNRMKLADVYIEQNPPEDGIENIARSHMANIKHPQELAQMKKNLEMMDFERLRTVIRHGMVKHFTVAELEFVIEMYSTAVGKSVMAKMGAYTAEIGPQLEESMRGIMDANVKFYEEQAELMPPEDLARMQGMENVGKRRQQAQAQAQSGEKPPEAIKLPSNTRKVMNGVYQASGLEDLPVRHVEL